MVEISEVSFIYSGIVLAIVLLVVACLRIGTKLNIKWLTIKGRLNRQPFIFAYLASTLLIIFNGMAIFETIKADNLILFLVMLVAMAMFMSVNMSVSMRRIQDLGYPGWYYVAFMIFITLVGNWVSAISYLNYGLSIYLIFFRGTIGANAYGEDLVK